MSKETYYSVKALNGLPVYCRYHSKHGLALGKGLKIGRYQDFTNKRNHVADVLQACCRRVAGVCRSVYVIRTLLRSATKLKSVKRKHAKRMSKPLCLLHASHHVYCMQVTIFTTCKSLSLLHSTQRETRRDGGALAT